MNADFFPRVSAWRFPLAAIEKSWSEMALDGLEGNEGLALWLGSNVEGSAVVRAVIRLRGALVTRKPGLIVIDGAVFNEIGDVAHELGMTLLGHIHSHGDRYVDLSPTDRAYGVGVPHYLSIVAPFFALRSPPPDLVGCGVHVFEPRGYFRRMPPQELRRRVQVEGAEDVPLVTVGGSDV